MARKEKIRCPWVAKGNSLYEKYHDKEWGVPVKDDRKIFEFLVLESMQAGLSWIIILSKRDNFRKAFAGFDPKKVSAFGKKEITRLLRDPGIIRNRLKIEAAVNNAHKFIAVQKEFGSFSKYMWQFVGGKTLQHRIRVIGDYPETICEAEVFAKDLKRRGFRFFGSTICYSHMQAIGMVNDHVVSCFRYKKFFK